MDILLISKDVFKPDYLSCYGGIKHHTPNIDKLASTGTIFENFYTVAPSTSMAFTCMFAGLNPHELERKVYTEVKPFDQCSTVFDIMKETGHECHVIWDKGFVNKAWVFSKVYGEATFHNLDIGQWLGPHRSGPLRKIEKKDPLTIVGDLMRIIHDIRSNESKPIFLWIHCPHVFKGCTGYGTDIHAFDIFVGLLSSVFDRKGIYLTADHGHMDTIKGFTGYGFHVYEPNIKIPLITPNHFNKSRIADVISNSQLKNIILDRSYNKQEFIYSDTTYYFQRHRKLMIRKGDYKYIYNKVNKSEELYDLKYDPHENTNLLLSEWFNKSRNNTFYLTEIFYYPRWEKAKETYLELKQEKDRIWRQGSWFKETLYSVLNRKKSFIPHLYGLTQRKSVKKGRWGSKALRVFK